MRTTLASLALAAAAIFATTAVAAPAGAADQPGTVAIIHGVPGVDVDVYVNGDSRSRTSSPRRSPTRSSCRRRLHDRHPPRRRPGHRAPIITGTATLPAGANATLIAHLDRRRHPHPRRVRQRHHHHRRRRGPPRGPPHRRRPGRRRAGRRRAGHLGPRARRRRTRWPPAGTVSASVAAAGTTEPVIGPADVPVVAGQVTIVYAIGSLEDGTLGAVVQTITVGERGRPPPRRLGDAAPTCPSPRRALRRQRPGRRRRLDSFPRPAAGRWPWPVLALAGHVVSGRRPRPPRAAGPDAGSPRHRAPP